MTEKTKKAARLISKVQINGVRLVDVAARSGIRSPGELEEVEVNLKPSARVPGPPESGVFYVLASFDLQVTGAGKKTPAVTLKATFELRYSVPEDLGEVTTEELAAFSEVNAIFNAWPYWREFIQSTFVRMNLPPILLPVFRLSDHIRAAKELEGKSKRGELASRQT